MITLQNVRKSYGDVTPLEDVSVTINDGDVISIIGPSGTGKSTLIRAISMLDPPTSGKIFIDGNEITAKGADLAAFRKKMGMVFQSFNLFPHLSVLENVMKAPMDILNMSKSDARELAIAQISAVGLEKTCSKYPQQLSGGQQQRIAIARTLAMNPDIIFFDEPTSALDPAMVGEVRSIIRQIADGKRTMMVVTHEMDFAKEISSRVFYMDCGGIYEDGTPEQIFEKPSKELTKAFIKRLCTLNLEIDDANRDLYRYFGEISSFCYHYQCSREAVGRIETVFEELCAQILADRHQKLSLMYSPHSKEATLEVTYDGEKIDTTDECVLLSMMIIKDNVVGVEYDMSGDVHYPNRIVLRFKS